MKKKLLFGSLALLAVGLIIFVVFNKPAQKVETAQKLYWFIPDGLRAEPDIFTIYRWAQEGKLPNIKKMMDNGAYGYSIPDFPSHTPTNFASLLTGAHPSTHGIADGPMHTEGSPLVKPSVAGFSSTAKKVAPIWQILEDAGKKVALLSIPGSTPPELDNGITIRGRWGGWGADTPSIIFEPLNRLDIRKDAGKAFRLFYLGQKLTQFVPVTKPSDWENQPTSFSEAKETNLSSYGLNVYAYVYDSTDDNITNYDKVYFSLDKKTEFLNLASGVWSDWNDVTLQWEKQDFSSELRIKVIKIWPENGDFRIRLFYNNMNKFITEPSNIAEEVTTGIGPMVDFVDNWPVQLIYEDEDKATFFEEAMDSLAWHKKATKFILNKYQPDAFIQDTYTSNQMLESRWWFREVDKTRPGYNEEKAKLAWDDLLKMYQGIDAILGEAIDSIDNKTLLVFSSDHGIMQLHKQVRLNNLFAQKGWIKYTIDEKTGEPAIDWENSKVVYMKMAYIYVSPNGLGGDWYRSSGEEYDKLRTEVIEAIKELTDEDGTKPLMNAVRWEDAPAFFDLPTDRIGDIVLEAAPGYQWWEEISADGKLFTEPLVSGYKQAVDAKANNGMWTPFMMMGPGVKKGYVLEEPISHVDQMPTILKLLNIGIPDYVEGRILNEIFE